MINDEINRQAIAADRERERRLTPTFHDESLERQMREEGRRYEEMIGLGPVAASMMKNADVQRTFEAKLERAQAATLERSQRTTLSEAGCELRQHCHNPPQQERGSLREMHQACCDHSAHD